MREMQAKIRDRQTASSLLRPLDEADRLRIEVFRKSRIDELFGRLEPIKIKVI